MLKKKSHPDLASCFPVSCSSHFLPKSPASWVSAVFAFCPLVSLCHLEVSSLRSLAPLWIPGELPGPEAEGIGPESLTPM